MQNTAGRILKSFWIPGIALLLLGHPGSAPADIFRWVDERGVVHFTDNPENIPAKYRGRTENILKAPPASGKPTVSKMGAPSAAPPPAAPASPPPAMDAGPPPAPASPGDGNDGQAEQLRAKISAKEQFIEKIDRKRSHTLNPMGNRFVSQEDLALYKKYSEELPKDRERLREIAPAAP